MKKLIALLFVAVALSTPLWAGEACCKDAATCKSAPVKQAEQTQKYVCPMHPEVTYDKPGKCPKCGMALVPVKAGEKS